MRIRNICSGLQRRWKTTLCACRIGDSVVEWLWSLTSHLSPSMLRSKRDQTSCLRKLRNIDGPTYVYTWGVLVKIGKVTNWPWMLMRRLTTEKENAAIRHLYKNKLFIYSTSFATNNKNKFVSVQLKIQKNNTTFAKQFERLTQNNMQPKRTRRVSNSFCKLNVLLFKVDNSAAPGFLA